MGFFSKPISQPPHFKAVLWGQNQNNNKKSSLQMKLTFEKRKKRKS
jgi:hypothetical protein